MKTISKKLLSLLLVAVLLVCAVPLQALAAEGSAAKIDLKVTITVTNGSSKTKTISVPEAGITLTEALAREKLADKTGSTFTFDGWKNGDETITSLSYADAQNNPSISAVFTLVTTDTGSSSTSTGSTGTGSTGSTGSTGTGTGTGSTSTGTGSTGTSTGTTIGSTGTTTTGSTTYDAAASSTVKIKVYVDGVYSKEKNVASGTTLTDALASEKSNVSFLKATWTKGGDNKGTTITNATEAGSEISLNVITSVTLPVNVMVNGVKVSTDSITFSVSGASVTFDKALGSSMNGMPAEAGSIEWAAGNTTITNSTLSPAEAYKLRNSTLTVSATRTVTQVTFHYGDGITTTTRNVVGGVLSGTIPDGNDNMPANRKFTHWYTSVANDGESLGSLLNTANVASTDYYAGWTKTTGYGNGTLRVYAKLYVKDDYQGDIFKKTIDLNYSVEMPDEYSILKYLNDHVDEIRAKVVAAGYPTDNYTMQTNYFYNNTDPTNTLTSQDTVLAGTDKTVYVKLYANEDDVANVLLYIHKDKKSDSSNILRMSGYVANDTLYISDVNNKLKSNYSTVKSFYTDTQWKQLLLGKTVTPVTSLALSEGGGTYIIHVITTGTTSSNADTSNPKTGDSIYVVVTVMAVTACGLAAAYILNKKRIVK